MKAMKRRRFLERSIGLGALAGSGHLPAYLLGRRALAAPNPNPPGQEFEEGGGDTVDVGYQHAPAAAVERWQDWKFGMRIHFGVYSVLSLDASVPLVGSSEEFRTIYSTLYQVFDPSSFDAGQWAEIAERAGMKYFVFPTRHADGFSMYATQTKVRSIRRIVSPSENRSDPGIGRTEPCTISYSVMDTPYKRDVVAAMVDAFRKRGLGIGLYYNWTDWHDPDYGGDNRSPFYQPGYSQATDPAAWNAFMQRTTESVREICTKFGKLDILSFDQGLPKTAWPETVKIVKMVRSLQPDVLMRNRGIGPYGDFSTPEHWVPNGPFDTRVGGKPWEAIEQLTRRWAYQPNDIFKSQEWVLRTLIDVVAKGGNFMPGVSPLPDGTFPRQTIERLAYVGDWLKVNGEAIYDTRPWTVYKEGEDIRFTRSRDGKYVYPISLKWPGESLVLKSLRAIEGSRMTLLGTRATIKWRQDKGGLVVQIPLEVASPKPSAQAYAFKVEALPHRESYE
jgi:alpha-L-fucosidase